jgi:hypothetical protein
VAEPEGGPQVVGRVPRQRLRAVRGRLAGVPRWRRIGAAVGAVGLAALAIGIIVVTELPGSSQGASPAAKSSGSTTVQRRDLVATDTESGTLSYANPQTVFNRLSGTITSLPNVGQLVKPGEALYHVSGAPVVLFNGTTPAYRDLTSGDSNGPDILQLNRDLRSLGFDPDHQIALNDTWQDATTTAVENWQSSLGETETGTVTLGQIVFLPGPQVITSVDTDLGSTGGASASAASATSTADTNVTPHADFVSLTMAASQASPSTPGDAPASTGVTTPTAAAAPCSQPGLPPSATGTPTTTTPAPPASCEKTGNQTTTTDTTTTPTTPTTTTTTTTTTSTTPATPTGPPANIPTKPTSGSRSPSEQAILLALLKAETLELKKSLSTSGGSAGGSSRSAAGTSGSTSGSTSSGSRSGGGGVSGGGGGGGGGSSSASASTGASSGGGSSSGSGASSGASTAQAILQTTSNQLVVTVDLDATKQSEAVVGEPVTVELPNGNTVDAKIIQVSPVAQSSSSTSSSSGGSGAGSTGSSSAPSATIPVTIKITGRHPASGLDQAAVSVNFEQQVEKNVLSVPVTALLATAGGGYAVQEAAAPHTLIAVTPGLFAAGYVQISGSQIYPGLQVTDSQG